MARPSEYDPAYVERVGDYFESYEPWYESPVEKQLKDGSTETRMERCANPPPSKIGIAKHLGISRAAVWDYERQHEEFRNAIKAGMDLVYPEILQENALLGKYAPAFSIFAAKNRMGWHDKQEVDHTVHIEPFILKNPEGETVMTLGSRVAGNHAA